eukprot:CAMPEP_0185009914 /NCGR_PEP_ID=MMETSP1098-20130426/93486_1 /TAXON_ID=89044 /ORGANISM="Spumella elongata, Strain CCAP 955/1" /LENGTH=280 /DNA_ID=CAMNT_0027538683 /DNA_START=70 /DNA_END=912 /DNA_ORIENTATION=-
MVTSFVAWVYLLYHAFSTNEGNKLRAEPKQEKNRQQFKLTDSTKGGFVIPNVMLHGPSGSVEAGVCVHDTGATQTSIPRRLMTAIGAEGHHRFLVGSSTSGGRVDRLQSEIRLELPGVAIGQIVVAVSEVDNQPVLIGADIARSADVECRYGNLLCSISTAIGEFFELNTLEYSLELSNLRYRAATTQKDLFRPLSVEDFYPIAQIPSTHGHFKSSRTGGRSLFNEGIIDKPVQIPMDYEVAEYVKMRAAVRAHRKQRNSQLQPNLRNNLISHHLRRREE